MARKPRQQVAGWIYHVTARGVDKRPVFRDDGDCQVYLVILKGVVAVFRWRIFAYCLMTNHIHLVVQTTLPNLAGGMQRLHGHYGRHFNRRHDREGHVFARRYYDKPIMTGAHLQVAVSYVHENPVTAGLCRQPEDWPRSSYSATAGLAADRFIDLTAIP